MYGEFNKAAQLKTSLAKYSIEFNDLAVQTRPHRIAYLRLLGRPYTLLYVRRSVGRLVPVQLSTSDIDYFIVRIKGNQYSFYRRTRLKVSGDTCAGFFFRF